MIKFMNKRFQSNNSTQKDQLEKPFSHNVEMNNEKVHIPQQYKSSGENV